MHDFLFDCTTSESVSGFGSLRKSCHLVILSQHLNDRGKSGLTSQLKSVKRFCLSPSSPSHRNTEDRDLNWTTLCSISISRSIDKDPDQSTQDSQIQVCVAVAVAVAAVVLISCFSVNSASISIQVHSKNEWNANLDVIWSSSLSLLIFIISVVRMTNCWWPEEGGNEEGYKKNGCDCFLHLDVCRKGKDVRDVSCFVAAWGGFDKNDLLSCKQEELLETNQLYFLRQRKK